MDSQSENKAHIEVCLVNNIAKDYIKRKGVYLIHSPPLSLSVSLSLSLVHAFNNWFDFSAWKVPNEPNSQANTFNI